jgi:hypothetical protein
MKNDLQLFRSVDFNWTKDLQSIWSDPAVHVEDLHKEVINQIVDDFLLYTKNANDNPIGQVIKGKAGIGKTHLVGNLRRRVWEANGWFVLLDIIGITDFWATTGLGFVESLRQRMPSGRTQYEEILTTVLRKVSLDYETKIALEEWSKKPERTRLDTVNLFLKLLNRIDDKNTTKHQDVIRALLFLGSDDWDANNLAYCWLLGLDVDEAKRKELRFLRGPPPFSELVRGMLWIMGLAGPTLIAVDQIDAIVSASNLLAGVRDEPNDDGERKARAIIDLLAGGLMDLHDLKKRALTVVSCLEETWPIIKSRAVKSASDRFEELPVLEPIKTRDLVEELICGRLDVAYSEACFIAPYRTWPFRPEAIDSAVGLPPREILKRCKNHRDQCIATREVFECKTLDGVIVPQPQVSLPSTLDQTFTHETAHAETSWLQEKENEDTIACNLIFEMCDLLLRHLDLPNSIDAVVKRDPDRKKPLLHSRISFIFHDEGDREHQYCFRILGHTHATAFQSRLKAAMTACGIDTALKFRHLFILRRDAPPSGPKTKALVDQFLKLGGKFIAPLDEDLRIFVALAAMEARKLPDFDAWLRQQQPLFKTRLFQEAGLCPPPFLAPKPSAAPDELAPPPQDKPTAAGAKPAPTQTPAGAQAEKPKAPPAAPRKPAASERVIPIGRRYERGALGDPVTLAADLLPRHVAVLAGPGSGKTVLLRRIVEEAALLGIPSIVLDPNNDLSRLDDAWPTRPESWSEEDAAKAETYRACADVVIWTPGVTSGNPISLNLLPDFAAIDDADEREQAIGMTWATLIPFLPAGGEKANRKKGVLADAIRRFAAGKGSALTDLIALLAELPDDVSEDSNAQKLASEIADQLRAAIAMNPLLKSIGEPLDPKTLFEAPSGKTRVSVINLGGLASEEARDSFVNRLQMSLFTFIKRHPNPTGCLYVIDEAQNFAPSGAGTACKASALSLAAQARKYGLGMMFATQTPKGVDNKIVSNCTTHVYGRMNAPATIDAIHDLMAAKGGAADDIGKLSKGEFYFSTEGSLRPFKVRTPLCLSWHPPNPPPADEVIQKARSKRV